MSLLTLFSCRNFIDEYVPRRAVLVPVLSMEVDLGSTEPQTRTFSIKLPGTYSLNTDLELRHGPQGVRAANRRFVLVGTAEIVDHGRHGHLRRRFEYALLDSEVGVRKLIVFDTNEVGGQGEKLFEITLDVDPAFREHYSKMNVYIRKEPKHPILD